MIDRIGRWARDLIRWWRKRRPLKATGSPEPVAPVDVYEPEASIAATVKEAVLQAVKKAKQRRARRPAHEIMRLKRTILDQLDDNTKIMARMKAYFPDEYGLYSQVGAVVIPHDEAFLYTTDLTNLPVSPWFLATRPAFGAIVCGNPHDMHAGKGHTLYPRLMHFLKMKSPREIKKRLFKRGRDPIQPISPTSDLYIFTQYYDEKDWAKFTPRKTRDDRDLCRFYSKAFAIEVPLEITADGHVRPLKILRERVLRFGKDRQADGIMTRRWDYTFSKEFIRAWGGQIALMSQQDFILMEIGLVLHDYEEASSSIIQVRAAKNGVCTLINVDVEETPDFFDDREDVIIDGIKKRIFHIVRPHERMIGHNRRTNVHLHFRGLREFEWNGYKIEISVPGRDHFDMKEVDIAARDVSDAGPKSTRMPELASWLVANQKARFGAMVGERGEPLPLAAFKDARNSRQPAVNPD